jgi:hypothetical protein
VLFERPPKNELTILPGLTEETAGCSKAERKWDAVYPGTVFYG